MMKEICVKQDIFNQTIGYGGWTLITIGLIFILIASYMEFGSNQFKEGREKWEIGIWCYDSILDGERECRENNTVENRFRISLTFLVSDILVIIAWINYKKKIFKFKWCDKL